MPGLEREGDIQHIGGPKLTQAEFQQWKQQQDELKLAATAAAADQRRRDLEAGRIPVEEMTGKELHEFHPELFEGF